MCCVEFTGALMVFEFGPCGIGGATTWTDPVDAFVLPFLVCRISAHLTKSVCKLRILGFLFSKIIDSGNPTCYWAAIRIVHSHAFPILDHRRVDRAIVTDEGGGFEDHLGQYTFEYLHDVLHGTSTADVDHKLEIPLTFRIICILQRQLLASDGTVTTMEYTYRVRSSEVYKD